jgi:uncharacterized membrane protein
MKVLLAASLAVNLLLIGFRVGYEFRQDERPRGEQLPASWVVRQMVQQVPEAKRSEAVALVVSRQDLYEQNRARFREAFRAVRDAIVAEPFDPGQLENAMQSQSEAALLARTASYEVIRDVVLLLDDGERAQFVHGLNNSRFGKQMLKDRPTREIAEN